MSHELSNRLHNYAEYTTQAQMRSSRRALLVKVRLRTLPIVQLVQGALEAVNCQSSVAFQMGETPMAKSVDNGLSPGPRVARPTLAELARAAGVNKSTASRALRGSPAIGTETRERIQQLAAELNYEPNASARRLFRAQTDVLAFTAPSLTRGNDGADPFLAELLSAVTSEAASSHQDVLLCNTQAGPEELETYRRVVGGHHADGLILMDLRPDDPRLEYLRAKGYPHVLFGRSALDMEEARHYPYPWVEVDNRAGARAGTRHMIELGHTRIGFLGADEAYICELDRLAGYRDTLAAAGIPYDSGLCTEGGITQEDGYRLTRQLLECAEPPTAIFAASDVLAVGAMRAAADAGRTVGREFPVIGFDDLGLATFVSPSLTTLRQPIAYVGRMLVRLLIGMLQGTPEPETHLLLQPELIIRDSTRRT